MCPAIAGRKSQEPEYSPVPPHSSRSVAAVYDRRTSTGVTARKNFFAKKKNESCGHGVPRWRERVCLSKILEVTCYAESSMAHGGCFSFGSAFSLPRAGRGFVSAFELGSGNRKNRRQCDANRNAGQRDRQFGDIDFRRGNRAQSAAHFARC